MHELQNNIDSTSNEIFILCIHSSILRLHKRVVQNYKNKTPPFHHHAQNICIRAYIVFHSLLIFNSRLYHFYNQDTLQKELIIYKELYVIIEYSVSLIRENISTND